MNIVVFNTAIGSFNHGDDVIMHSAEDALAPLLDRSYIMELATHIGNFNFIHYLKNSKKLQFADTCDYKFIMGINLLSADLLRSIGQWVVDPVSKRLYKNSIMVGVGITKSGQTPTFYTKAFYKVILRKDIAHSVRDEESKIMLEQAAGVTVLNTGCPTLWKLTPEVCSRIPVQKAKNVVFTLSGQPKYQNMKCDQQLIDIVERNYDHIYYWVQTYDDEGYLNKLHHTKEFTHIYSLKQYQEVCQNGNVDYVGTRLHGGVYAMQNGVRAVIIEIDHRAKGFKEINNINSISRDNLDALEDYINGDIHTEIHLREKEIKEWISQFY